MTMGIVTESLMLRGILPPRLIEPLNSRSVSVALILVTIMLRTKSGRTKSLLGGCSGCSQDRCVMKNVSSSSFSVIKQRGGRILVKGYARIASAVVP